MIIGNKVLLAVNVLLISQFRFDYEHHTALRVRSKGQLLLYSIQRQSTNTSRRRDDNHVEPSYGSLTIVADRTYKRDRVGHNAALWYSWETL